MRASESMPTVNLVPRCAMEVCAPQRREGVVCLAEGSPAWLLGLAITPGDKLQGFACGPQARMDMH